MIFQIPVRRIRIVANHRVLPVTFQHESQCRLASRQYLLSLHPYPQMLTWARRGERQTNREARNLTSGLRESATPGNRALW